MDNNLGVDLLCWVLVSGHDPNVIKPLNYAVP